MSKEEEAAGNQKVVAEITQAMEASGSDTITAEHVVKMARSKSSALHDYFEWDNNKAGNEYRLEQARRLLRRITITRDPDHGKPVQVFVSLSNDRKNSGGGYRLMREVLSDSELREELVKTALSEFQAMRRRYQRVTELSSVFAAIDKAVDRQERKKLTAA